MVLKTLGELKLEGSDFQRPKALLLLVYLALEGQKERRHLAELFWPSHDNALGNLAMTLSRLRKVVSKDLEADEIFAQTTLLTDVDDFQLALEHKEWSRITNLYQGGFLEGIDTSQSGIEVEEWIYEKREHFASLARYALICSAEEKAKQQHFSQAAQEATKAYHLRYAPEPETEDLKRLYLLLQADQHPTAQTFKKKQMAMV